MGQPANRKLKNVAFNIEIEQDLFEYANNMRNFSGWVKQYLRMDMMNSKSTQPSIRFVQQESKPIIIQIPQDKKEEKVVVEKKSVEISDFF